ncbi:hypothetical protein XI09_02035 [Bradyrhizobium sp. CCBAU 11386]|nr:hypothetical protein [Bradyrhizobium sp. CCBAU 11386]
MVTSANFLEDGPPLSAQGKSGKGLIAPGKAKHAGDLHTYFELVGTIVSLLRRVPIRDVDLDQVPANAGPPPAH